MTASIKIYCALIVALIFWASAFVGIRIGLTAYSPGGLALLRFLVASVSLLIIKAFIVDKQPLPWSLKVQLMMIGVAGIGIYNICLNIGEVTVSAGVASFVIGLMPVITIILSVVVFKERPKALVWSGIGLSFLGLLLMITAEKTSLTNGSDILMILISAIMGAFYNVSQKRFLHNHHPVAVTCWGIWGGTLILLGFIPNLYEEIGTASLSVTVAAIYLGIFPAALAYLAWSYVLKHLPASKASIYLYSLPMSSTLMGFIFLDEKLSRLSLAGGLIALSGAFIATRTQVISALQVSNFLKKNKLRAKKSK